MSSPSFKDRYLAAVSIAADAHHDQFRASNDDGPRTPYITHPIEVAAIAEHYGLPEDIILALIDHDVLEDGGNREEFAERILKELGSNVLRIVEGLTDPEFPEGTLRKDKKKAINLRLSQLPFDVQMAKLCDVFHNIRDINEAKPKFAKKYLAEKADQLACLSPEVKETKLFQDVHARIKQQSFEASQNASFNP